MKKEAIKNLQDVLIKWKDEKYYFYEKRDIYVYKSPIVEGEFVFQFSNSLHNFLCKGKAMPINLLSKSFHTGTLSENPLSDNPNGDKHRLEKFLNYFDDEFLRYVGIKIDECIEGEQLQTDSFFL